MEKTKYITSVNQTIKRSQISPADYNPRKISEKARSLLKKNIKAIGILGGFVWNKRTGNLVSGHQRLSILDELHHYEASNPDTDYLITVEVVDFDLKTEKEQNILMNNKNVQGDYDLTAIKGLIPDIDYKLAGLDDIDLSMMGISINVEAQTKIDEVNTELQEMQQPAADRKEAVKATKKLINEKAKEKADNMDAFIMVTFEDFQSKVEFMQRFGYDPNQRYIVGDHFNSIIERVEED